MSGSYHRLTTLIMPPNRLIFFSFFSVIFVLCSVTVGYFQFYLPPPCRSDHKEVHVSIDDCVKCLQELSTPGIVSIFDVEFFRQLKEWHDRYNAKFTCYIYGQTAHFSLASIPGRFKKEFQDEADWLKFGYHASHQGIEQTQALVSCHI